MSRAGREPAEDVKRRLVSACQEVGLVISSAHMHLMREHALRLIYVGASIPNWPQETPMLTVMARVDISGQWPETVDPQGRATPYGIYDQAANHALVMVGVGVITAAFAVASIRRWWEKYGCQRYTDSKHIMIECDGGGCNGHRPRLWNRNYRSSLMTRACRSPCVTTRAAPRSGIRSSTESSARSVAIGQAIRCARYDGSWVSSAGRQPTAG